jgi:hypothetical protein
VVTSSLSWSSHAVTSMISFVVTSDDDASTFTTGIYNSCFSNNNSCNTPVYIIGSTVVLVSHIISLNVIVMKVKTMIVTTLTTVNNVINPKLNIYHKVLGFEGCIDVYQSEYCICLAESALVASHLSCDLYSVSV